MKNVFKALTVLITLFSLTGCGLKGPLYFPPADKKRTAADQTGRDANAIHGAG